MRHHFRREPPRILSGRAAAVQQNVFHALGRTVLGTEYFKELAKLKPAFVVRSEITVERLVTGQDLMAFGGMATRVTVTTSAGPIQRAGGQPEIPASR